MVVSFVTTEDTCVYNSGTVPSFHKNHTSFIITQNFMLKWKKFEICEQTKRDCKGCHDRCCHNLEDHYQRTLCALWLFIKLFHGLFVCLFVCCDVCCCDKLKALESKWQCVQLPRRTVQSLHTKGTEESTSDCGIQCMFPPMDNDDLIVMYIFHIHCFCCLSSSDLFTLCWLWCCGFVLLLLFETNRQWWARGGLKAWQCEQNLTLSNESYLKFIIVIIKQWYSTLWCNFTNNCTCVFVSHASNFLWPCLFLFFFSFFISGVWWHVI